jgi:DNA-binding response OmpR family regulator
MVMHNKPATIALDLRMHWFSGFELCRTFASMTFTQLIPIFVVSGEAGSTTKALGNDLGATAYFEKTIASRACGLVWSRFRAPDARTVDAESG